MRLNKQQKLNIWFTIIATAIILIAGITAIHLIHYFSSSSKTPQCIELFSQPDSIEVRLKNRKITLYPSDEFFNQILTFNNARKGQKSYYYASDYILDIGTDSEEIILTYCYTNPVYISIPLRLENRTIPAQNTSFILTGDYNNSIIINEQPSIFYTGLNINAELITLVEELLKDPIESKNDESAESIFKIPSEILLQIGEKKLIITQKDEEFYPLIAANNRRLISSFYTPSNKFKYNITGENYEDFRLIYCYNDSATKVSIPLENKEAIVQADRILFPITSEGDKFVLDDGGEYYGYTGLTVSNELLQMVLECLSSP